MMHHKHELEHALTIFTMCGSARHAYIQMNAWIDTLYDSVKLRQIPVQ